ncbi:MAG: NAD-dependent epimerase/dehydratase family protein [Bacteriovoracaceae bacterium]
MKILVTGASGFLGFAIAKKLRQQGHEIINFSRSSPEKLFTIGVDTFEGDLLESADLLDLFETHQFDAVFHVAGKIAMWGDWSDFYNINVLGTKLLLELSKTYGVKKFIYTSSPSVAFGQDDLKGVDESVGYPEEYFSMYARSKAMAEQTVLKMNSQEFLTCALRPHLIFGPGDENLIPRLLNAHRTGKLKRVGNGDNLVDVIYVDNAADAHIEAFKHLNYQSGVDGEAFFIGQGPVNLWSFIDQIMEKHQLPKVTKSISFKKAYAIGSVIETGLKILGKKNVDPPMTRFVAMQLAKSHYFSHKKAEERLHWKPQISLEKGIQSL